MLNSPMTSFKQTLLIALSLTLGACATTREQIETEIDDAVTNEVSAQPEAWVTPANIGGVQVGWIAAFNDPTPRKHNHSHNTAKPHSTRLVKSKIISTTAQSSHNAKRS